MVTIATFNEPAKARQLKERLQQSGVKADIHNEGHLQAAVFMSKPQANAKVLVEEQDFEAAHKLMVELEANEPELGAAAIRCPQCQSPRIEYPQLTRKFLTPSIASILFALKVFEKEFYCQDCHFTWGKGGEPMPRPEAWETFS
ncbi:MAG: putative signal transducing protein [Chthoniobacterales bacterium]